MIKIVHRKDIDEKKWEQLNASSEHPYFTSIYYLDATCKNWKALVFGDYKACFPFYVKKFLFFEIISHPLFIRTFSTIGNSGYHEQFLTFLKEKYLFVYVFTDNFSSEEEGMLKKRKYQKLTFLPQYEEHWSNYAQNAKRQITKFEKSSAEIKHIKDVEDFEKYIDFFYAQKKGELEQITRKTLNVVGNIALKAAKQNKLQLIEARENGTLLAFGFFIVENDKALYLKGIVGDTGKTIGAMYAVFDAFIKKNHSTLRSLDFGGSDSKGLSEFNLKFGAEHNYYINLTSNRLPFPINRWMNRRYKLNENTD